MSAQLDRAFQRPKEQTLVLRWAVERKGVRNRQDESATAFWCLLKLPEHDWPVASGSPREGNNTQPRLGAVIRIGPRTRTSHGLLLGGIGFYCCTTVLAPTPLGARQRRSSCPTPNSSRSAPWGAGATRAEVGNGPCCSVPTLRPQRADSVRR